MRIEIRSAEFVTAVIRAAQRWHFNQDMACAATWGRSAGWMAVLAKE